MLNIIVCTVMISSMVNDSNGSHFFEGNATLQGNVLGQNEAQYLVDFSADARKQGFEGNFTHLLVRKDKCVQK